MAQSGSDVDRAVLNAALERAMARIHVSELVRRRGGRRLDRPPSQE
ncbi:MAG: hypothetical protein ACR2H5_17225 [Ktedonobacteraceae bacterium]